MYINEHFQNPENKIDIGNQGGLGGQKGGLELGKGSEMLFELKFSQDIGHIVIFHLKSIKLTLGVKGAMEGQKRGWSWEGEVRCCLSSNFRRISGI